MSKPTISDQDLKARGISDLEELVKKLGGRIEYEKRAKQRFEKPSIFDYDWKIRTLYFVAQSIGAGSELWVSKEKIMSWLGFALRNRAFAKCKICNVQVVSDKYIAYANFTTIDATRGYYYVLSDDCYCCDHFDAKSDTFQCGIDGLKEKIFIPKDFAESELLFRVTDLSNLETESEVKIPTVLYFGNEKRVWKITYSTEIDECADSNSGDISVKISPVDGSPGSVLFDKLTDLLGGSK